MPRKNTTGQPHHWHFYRAGGVEQVRLESGADILHLRDLDQKLWIALSCPVKGLEFDERTLRLLDSDGDAHVRPPEILDAIDWLARIVKDADGLLEHSDSVPLSNIRTDTTEGKRVLAASKHVLRSLGKGDATAISVADTAETATIFSKARHNGDGVVMPETIGDPAAQQVAREILDCVGGSADRSGGTGITKAAVEKFFAECSRFDASCKVAEQDSARVLPLGDKTAAANAAYEAVRTKVDDFFARCRLIAFDPRAQGALNRAESTYLDIAAQDLSMDTAEVAAFPIAMTAAGATLPLGDGVNPAWRARIERLRDDCVGPLLGRSKTELSAADWLSLRDQLAPHRAWAGDGAGDVVGKLGIARVREILKGKSRAVLDQAIADDLAVADEVDAIDSVGKLTLLYRDLHALLENYVSFKSFYAREGAVFQAGTLYLDGRSCDLCFDVTDAAKHGTLAPMAKTFLAYVDCKRNGKKRSVACAFTSGDSDNLFVGRNGLFYDRDGDDWDATISRIVDHPISIPQAFWSPYKKLLRWIEEQVAKRAAAADAASTANLQAAATATGESAASGKPPAQKPKLDIGVVAAIGVAVGGITAAFGALLEAFFGLGIWMPLGVLGVILAISGPSMLIAWLKLRQRNLGPILDSNGWAVNALTKVNIPLGRSLTATPHLPDGATRTLKDPYAPKKRLWPRLLLVLVVLGGAGYALWRTGHLSRWFDFVPPPAAAPAETAPGDGEGK